jgi:hypothetical protein
MMQGTTETIDLFAKADEIAETLFRRLRFHAASFPRYVWCKGSPFQGITVIRNVQIRQPDGESFRERWTLHIVQWWPAEPAVVTAVKCRWNAELQQHEYERISVREFMGTPSPMVAARARQLEALKDYFKSLPRSPEYGSADDVVFMEWEDADIELVEKTYKAFGEI